MQNTDSVRSTAEVTRHACIVTAKRGLPKLNECIYVLRQISRFGVLPPSNYQLFDQRRLDHYSVLFSSPYFNIFPCDYPE